MNGIELKRKKLLYRSVHRGCKEADILIGEFAKKYIDLFDEVKLDEYAKILELDDCTLYNIICEKIVCGNYDINHALIQMIIDFQKTQYVS